MLKTMSGRSTRSRSGKFWSASRRMTVPYEESAEATASIVAAESHSAYTSSIELLGGSSSARASLIAPTSPTGESGFWLYANPMRVIQSRLGRLRRLCRQILDHREHCVAFHGRDMRAQDKCHFSFSSKIGNQLFLGNDFLREKGCSHFVLA